MTRSSPLVSIVTVTYNSVQHLPEYLQSIFQQTYRHIELVFVDSASTDNTCDVIHALAPDALLIRSAVNLGYRRGTNVGAKAAQGKYILVLNDDTVLDQTCISNLVSAMEMDEQIGLCCPLIMDHYSGTVNTAGNVISLSGFYSARGKGMAASQFQDIEELGSVSGCCFIIRAALVEDTGLFSQDFDCYPAAWHATCEEVDLSWHIRAQGWRIVLLPSSIVSHKYQQKSLSPERLESLVFGRLLLMLRRLEARSILLLVPYWLIVEMALVYYVALRGPRHVCALFRVYLWALTHLDSVASMRRRVRARMIVEERLVTSFWSSSVEISPALQGSLILKVGCAVLRCLSCVYRKWVFAA